MLVILINIKFDWSMLFGFLGGIFAGVSITFLIYLFFILLTLKGKKNIVHSKVAISDKEMLERINKSKLAFKEKKLKGSKSINYASKLCKDLTYDMASAFFPDSNYPLLELSIDEILLLATYINKRVDEVLDHKGLRIIRKLKVSTIVNATEIKRKVDENAIIKATKKYKIMSAWRATQKVINLVNPFWWAKKLVVNGTINIVINQMCLLVIGIVGEETYKIYSKKVFSEELNLDSGNAELIKEIEGSLADIGEGEGYEE